jgi:hypothetical protein
MNLIRPLGDCRRRAERRRDDERGRTRPTWTQARRLVVAEREDVHDPQRRITTAATATYGG